MAFEIIADGEFYRCFDSMLFDWFVYTFSEKLGIEDILGLSRLRIHTRTCVGIQSALLAS